MSRTFTDDDLLTWEAYPSGSRRGASERPAIIFHCVTDLATRARYVDTDGDAADAERLVNTVAAEELRAMLARALRLP